MSVINTDCKLTAGNGRHHIFIFLRFLRARLQHLTSVLRGLSGALCAWLGHSGLGKGAALATTISLLSDVAPRAEALVVDGPGMESQLCSEPRLICEMGISWQVPAGA